MEIAFPEDDICAALRGEARRWRHADHADAVARLLDAARYHGVLPLLAAEGPRGTLADWPEAVLAACREAARAQAIAELANRAEAIRVLAAFASDGVTPLVLKGASLAYNLYPNPILRPRADTDLLIAPEQRRDAGRTLERLGYRQREAVAGNFISYQASWAHPASFGTDHSIDLHWRINNSQILAKAAVFGELASRAVAVPALGPAARALAPADALLLACIHRAGHVNAPYYVNGIAHHGIDRLIWLYDIHLLASKLSAMELDEFAAQATIKRIRTICNDGLMQASRRLGTPIPARVLAVLNHPGPVEPSSHFLNGNRARLMLEDLRALEDWSSRVGWAMELAFPPRSYMRAKYSEAGATWLPILYLRRGLTGVSRLLMKHNRRADNPTRTTLPLHH